MNCFISARNRWTTACLAPVALVHISVLHMETCQWLDHWRRGLTPSHDRAIGSEDPEDIERLVVDGCDLFDLSRVFGAMNAGIAPSHQTQDAKGARFSPARGLSIRRGVNGPLTHVKKTPFAGESTQPAHPPKSNTARHRETICIMRRNISCSDFAKLIYSRFTLALLVSRRDH
jgi:hypothetical protein